MVSQKQLLANQQNALKSTGPKTTEGKALAKRNSLKHGLLAKEVVITEGDGAEDQQAFDAVLTNFVDHFIPMGPLEEMLVEKIAVSYWRLRRANRYEVGVLRRRLDTATADYYEEKNTYSKSKLHKTDAEIDQQIQESRVGLAYWQKDNKQIDREHKKGADLESLYDLEGYWDTLEETFEELEEYSDSDQPDVIRKALNEAGITDDQIWQAVIKICQDSIDSCRQEIEQLEKEKVKNKLRLQVNKKCAAIPPKLAMDNLLRYETAIERQLYKAINQLERLQRLRAGDHVPAPVQVDVNTLGSGDIKLV